MRRTCWLAIVVAACAGVCVAASVDERGDFSKRLARDVVKPGLNLANEIVSRERTGQSPVGDPELIARADALSEKALAYADEARAKWCRTEQTGDFWLYMAAQHELLAQDLVCQNLRTGDSRLIQEATQESGKVREALSKIGS